MSFIVAIDGPAGAGKSSIAEVVAERLGMTRVNTGSLYRAVTLLALEAEAETEEAVLALMPEVDDIRLDGDGAVLRDRDLTQELRSEQVTRAVSRVSAYPRVREALLAAQRRLAHAPKSGAVLEGRDIGTVVCPDADVKIFLTASLDERARRRHLDLEAGGASVTFDEIKRDLARRDGLDEGRSAAPLLRAPDAKELDSTQMSFEEVVDAIVKAVRRVAPQAGQR